jgi:hypothetical protein
MSDRSKPSGTTGATGAGSEAAEGIHGASEDRPTGADDDRAGSEPLADRENEHRSGYGGAGGKPVRSSDQRDGEIGPKH